MLIHTHGHICQVSPTLGLVFSSPWGRAGPEISLPHFPRQAEVLGFRPEALLLPP